MDPMQRIFRKIGDIHLASAKSGLTATEQGLNAALIAAAIGATGTLARTNFSRLSSGDAGHVHT